MKFTKRGQVGTGTVTTLVLGFVGLIILVFASYIILSSLTSTNILTGSYATSMTNINANYTAGVNTLFSNTSTVFAVAVIALILGILAIVFVLLRRGGFGSGSGSL